MKYLMIVPMLVLMNCAKVNDKPVAASQPSEPTVVTKMPKFFVNFLADENGTKEVDCTYLDSKESEKTLHFLFACNGVAVHVGFVK